MSDSRGGSAGGGAVFVMTNAAGRNQVLGYDRDSADQRYAYLADFGDGTLSSCTVAADGTLGLLESVAATTTPDQPSVRDAGTTRDGRYLYAIDVTSQSVHGWAVGGNGRLSPVGAFPGLPVTAAGLAAA